jgi:phage terminase large subunit
LSGRTLQIPTAEVFAPLLEPARYKGAYGGRGSGKSHFFAGLLVEDALRFPSEAGEGLRGLCVREIQKSLKQSAKRLIEGKLIEQGLGEADGFKVFEAVIKTPKDGVLEFQGMQDHTAESVKSFEGFHRAWKEEAQTMSATSLALLRPTIRWENRRLGLTSELWDSWNPRRKNDPVDMMLRGDSPPTGSIVVKANWSDNPWFPAVLEQERLDCLKNTPDQYDHIWEGGYATVLAGAYYAQSLAQARLEGRIGRVAADPLLTIKLICDIGGTGAKADAFSIVAEQWVGREIRVLNYYEAVGQPLASHLNWMRAQGYTPERVQIILPHDGASHDKVYDVSYESAFCDAGYDVVVIPNQGKGAALMRVETSRRLFPSIWFNEPTTTGLIDALGWYHEKRDTERNIGLGPDHDWSSNGADAFGLGCVAYEEPQDKRRIERPNYGQSGWMM